MFRIILISIVLFGTSRVFGAENPLAWWKAEANQDSAGLGFSVGSGDFNGDGYDDLVIGADVYDNANYNEGMVFVWYGDSAGLGDGGNPTNAGWKAEANQWRARFGYSVSTGDFNGDSYDDVVVSALLYDNGEIYEGMVFVWEGSSSGLGPDGNPTNADWKAESNQAYAFLGSSVSSGDLNGDGYDDLLIGADEYDNGVSNDGMVFVWYGDSTGLGPDGNPTNAAWKAESNSSICLFWLLSWFRGF